MNDSVMGIAIKLYRNPELLELIKLFEKLNEQGRQNILIYLESELVTNCHQ